MFVGLKAYHESPSSPISRYQSPEESVSINRWFPYKNLYMTEGGIEHTFKYKSWLTGGALVSLVGGAHVEGKSNVIAIKFMECRWDNDLLCNLPIGTSFDPQNISWSLQVRNPTTGMLFCSGLPIFCFPNPFQTLMQLSHRIEQILTIPTTLHSTPYLLWKARYRTCRVFLSGKRRRFRARIVYCRKGFFNWNTLALRSWESAQ